MPSILTFFLQNVEGQGAKVNTSRPNCIQWSSLLYVLGGILNTKTNITCLIGLYL